MKKQENLYGVSPVQVNGRVSVWNIQHVVYYGL